jgi:DNA-binding GntR family transcriptional regulator
VAKRTGAEGIEMRASSVKKAATLREQVFEVVLSQLKNGAFAPGERITEEGLAKRLEVSRTPIREALGQLTKQGVLHARRGGGYVVPSPTIPQIRNILAVRALLEPPAVRMAAGEYGAAEIDRISKAIEAETSAITKAQPQPFARANESFRHALFGSISNVALSTLIAQFESHLHFIRAVTLNDQALRREIVVRQSKIRDAVKRHDGELAESLWRSYLRLTEDTLVQTLGELERTSSLRGGSRADAA